MICCVLCSSALADSGKGLLHTFKEWNEKYNENTEANYDITLSSGSDALFKEDLFYENSGISLMSLTPEDIDNGVVKVTMYSLPQSDTTYVYNNAWLYTTPVASSPAINKICTMNRNFSTQEFPAGTAEAHWFDRIEIDGTGTSVPLFEKGSIFDFSMSEVQCYWEVEREVYSGSKWTKYYLNEEQFNKKYFMQIVFHDMNGNVEKYRLEDYYMKPSGDGFYFSGTSPEVPFDTYKITFELVYTIDGAFGVPMVALTKSTSSSDYPIYWTYHYIGFVNTILKMEEVDQTTGFLSSIVTAVNNIWTAIVNLPKNIVNFIVDGLTSLFIPPDGFFDGYVERWDTFFAEHFGFIYTAIDAIVDLFTVIVDSMESESVGVISIPSFTYNFSGTDFTFGGWEVDLIPEGMEGLINVLRMVVNIVLTLLFVNMGYRKFQSIIGNTEG